MGRLAWHVSCNSKWFIPPLAACAMLTVHFLRYDGKHVDRAGPFPWLRVDANSLRTGPDGAELARYQGGIWYTPEFNATKYVVHGVSCALRFEDEKAADSASFGPVDQVDVVDGAIYIPPGHRLVAHLDEVKKAWYVYQSKGFWPALILEHCTGP